jgi:hypothetical protein
MFYPWPIQWYHFQTDLICPLSSPDGTLKVPNKFNLLYNSYLFVHMLCLQEIQLTFSRITYWLCRCGGGGIEKRCARLPRSIFHGSALWV